MATSIEIEIEGRRYEAEIGESACAGAIADALPIEGRANIWGEEIYFEIAVAERLDETAREIVELGDIGYWPAGRAICFFFGPTPMSSGDEIRPASAVNIVGSFLGDLEPLKSVGDGVAVTIRARG